MLESEYTHYFFIDTCEMPHHVTSQSLVLLFNFSSKQSHIMKYEAQTLISQPHVKKDVQLSLFQIYM